MYISLRMRARIRQAIAVVVVVLAIVGAVLTVYALYWQPWVHQSYYLDIMNSCHDPSTKVIVRSWFVRDYNFTEIYDWTQEILSFVPVDESFPDDQRRTDPIETKEFGKGRCEEFSILYVATCLAHQHECRLVIATDCSGLVWVDKYAWAEVKVDGQWVHVDPSERRWNEPQMYQEWSWGESVGSRIRVFAFEEGKLEEITENYA